MNKKLLFLIILNISVSIQSMSHKKKLVETLYLTDLKRKLEEHHRELNTKNLIQKSFLEMEQKSTDTYEKESYFDHAKKLDADIKNIKTLIDETALKIKVAERKTKIKSKCKRQK